MWMALSAVVLLAGVMIFLVAALPPKSTGGKNPNKDLLSQFKRKVEADDKGLSTKEYDLEKGSTTRVDSDDEYTHTPKPRRADSVSRRSTSRRSVDHSDRRSERSRRSSRHRAPVSEEDEDEDESAATEEVEAASTVRSSRSRGSRKHRKSRRAASEDEEDDERTHGYVQCARAVMLSRIAHRSRLIYDRVHAGLVGSARVCGIEIVLSSSLQEGSCTIACCSSCAAARDS